MIVHKAVTDYDDYIRRQGKKLIAFPDKFSANNAKKIDSFARIFKTNIITLNYPGNVLCLGARAGWEVLGAKKAGFVGSVGIDLFPASEDVIQADWHHTPFGDSLFYNVYTNSIDHCCDLDKLIAESKRVLRPGGVFFLMITQREDWKGQDTKTRLEKSNVEFLAWDNVSEFIPIFGSFGFKLIRSKSDGKWCYLFFKLEK